MSISHEPSGFVHQPDPTKWRAGGHSGKWVDQKKQIKQCWTTRSTSTLQARCHISNRRLSHHIDIGLIPTSRNMHRPVVVLQQEGGSASAIIPVAGYGSRGPRVVDGVRPGPVLVLRYGSLMISHGNHDSVQYSTVQYTALYSSAVHSRGDKMCHGAQSSRWDLVGRGPREWSWTAC